MLAGKVIVNFHVLANAVSGLNNFARFFQHLLSVDTKACKSCLLP